MDTLFTAPLFYIYLIYGLSFLVMAYRIAGGMKRATSIALVSSFFMLVLFGVAHGIAEIIDWIRFINKTLGNPENPVLFYASQFLLISSFVFLLQFGINLMTYKSARKGVFRAIPAVLFAVFAVVLVALGISDIPTIGLIGRYSFGFIGAAVSSIMLFRLGITMKALGDRKLVQGLNLAAIGFACYAVFGGLIIAPVIGLPVQLFRAICALTISIASSFILGVFKVE
jgi:hypothetical protein